MSAYYNTPAANVDCFLLLTHIYHPFKELERNVIQIPGLHSVLNAHIVTSKRAGRSNRLGLWSGGPNMSASLFHIFKLNEPE